MPPPSPTLALARRAPDDPSTPTTAPSHGPATQGPATHGPATHGPATHGPATHGATVHPAVTHAAVHAQSVSASSLLVQMVVGLVVIIVLIKLASRFVQGRGGGGRGLGHGSRPQGVSVVGRQSLGKGVQVAMVAAGTQTYLLGVTQRQVTLLGEIDTGTPAELGTGDGAGAGLQLLPGGNAALASGGSLPGWKSAIEQMRVRTTRRA